MKIVKLSGSPRENVGKKDAKNSRKKGKVPCVLYGGEEQIHFSALEKDFIPLIFTPEVMFIEIVIDGKSYRAIIQDIQYHPVTDRVLHADFLELNDGKPITMAIPVSTKGTAIGVLRGGRLAQRIRKLPVKALPTVMPENIVIDISNLDIGDSIKVKDLTIQDATILSNPFNAIVSVKTARGVVATAEDDETETEEGEETES